MFAVPRPALALGLAGLIPFLYGAAVRVAPDLRFAGLDGVWVLEVYGLIIFSYMTGVFWGFAAAAGRTGWGWMTLSVLPAVVAFLTLAATPDAIIPTLLLGFPLLLVVDVLFWRARIAPRWWLSLRGLLTAIVTACLYLGAAA